MRSANANPASGDGGARQGIAFGQNEPAEPKRQSSALQVKPGRPRYVLVLEPLPRVDGIRALRALLKAALRRYGLKCLSVERTDGGAS